MGFLSGYRVLDLTDVRGALAGRILADLGADVVQVELSDGSAARRETPLGPAAEGGAHQSYFWAALGANKRSVALDPSDPSDISALDRLCQVADVVIESQGPLEQPRFGLRREHVMAKNSGLVWCSISPFGLTGPKATFASSDIVLWAAGGTLDPCRSSSGEPQRVSVPQAWFHAGSDAAVGIMLALTARRTSGSGQHVEVSAQRSVSLATLGLLVGASNIQHGTTRSWKAKDGLLQFSFAAVSVLGHFMNNLFTWMRDEGVDVGRFADWDWSDVADRVAPEDIEAVDEEARALTSSFFLTKTKLEVIEGAVKWKVLASGILDVEDIAASPQLASRGYFTTVGEGERTQRLPGAFAKIDAPAFEIHRPAPGVGEHTAEVLAEWVARDPTSGTLAVSRSGASAVLDGVTVLDLSWGVAGPLIGRVLADFGATVVRVESAGRLDTARSMPPLYETSNAGKLGICLDLGSGEARKVLRDLAGWADVVLESFSPGVLRRWDLDMGTLRGVNPRLVALSTTLCGQEGPWSSLTGFGHTGSALAGFHNLVGEPDGDPIGTYGPYTDYMAPRYGLVAVLAALDWRERSGKGCYINLAQTEAAVHFLAPEMADWFASGHKPGRLGNRSLRYAPHGVFRCQAAEGSPSAWVAIAAESDEQWQQLAAVIGPPGLGHDRRFATAAGRLAAAAELEELVRAWTSQRTAGEAEEILQGVGVPAHRAANPLDFQNDPQIVHSGYLVEIDQPERGRVLVEGMRFDLSRTPGRVRGRAPLLGEHRDLVLRQFLHYDEATCRRLEASGALR